jgi:glycerophosphoryl diester phosphodiesterase
MKKLFIGLIVLFIFGISSGQMEFIAHRGASAAAPENTLASVKLAWKVGADAAEVDIHLSDDKKVVVMHDYNTKRTSGQDHIIKETSSVVLRKLDVGSFKDIKYRNEKVPFLKEIIKTIPHGKKLVVEIKCKSEVLPFLEEIVNKSRKKEQLVFIAFDWNTIVETKKMFPENKCYWLSSNRKDVLSKLIGFSESGLDGLNLNYSVIDETIVTLAGKSGIEVLAWTVDDPVEAKRLIKLGITRITTNKPDWLKSNIAGM